MAMSRHILRQVPEQPPKLHYTLRLPLPDPLLLIFIHDLTIPATCRALSFSLHPIIQPSL
jgi:hypothetical protein